MKRIVISIVLTVVLTLIGIAWVNGEIIAQVKTGQSSVQEQLNNINIEIPFVDKDGDGINDLLQNGWGLRFIQRYKNRRAVWNQMNQDGERGNQLIDTDGDGVPDTPFREYMRNFMQQQMDTDGDGIPDTPWGEHMRRRFQMFDLDGDGIPDELTPEQIRQHFQEMMEWRRQMRENLMNGLPAFTDADGDGIPDNLPPGFGWMRRRGRIR